MSLTAAMTVAFALTSHCAVLVNRVVPDFMTLHQCRPQGSRSQLTVAQF
jgi:hypothetical protein